MIVKSTYIHGEVRITSAAVDFAGPSTGKNASRKISRLKLTATPRNYPSKTLFPISIQPVNREATIVELEHPTF